MKIKGVIIFQAVFSNSGFIRSAYKILYLPPDDYLRFDGRVMKNHLCNGPNLQKQFNNFLNRTQLYFHYETYSQFYKQMYWMATTPFL